MSKKPYSIFSLSNGLEVIFYPFKSVKTVSLNLYVKFGHFYGRNIAHFIEHILGQGNRSYPSYLKISLEEEKLGIHSRIFTSGEYTVIEYAFPRENFKKVLSFLTEYVFYPLFSPQGIEKEKQILTQEYLTYIDNPPTQFLNKLFVKFFGENHPYILSQITKESLQDLEKINKKILKNYFVRYYCPSNMVMGIAGDLDKRKVKQDLKEIFGQFAYKKPRKYPVIPKINFKKKTFYFPDKQQLIDFSILFSVPGLAELSRKEGVIIYLLASLLGWMKNSRLYLRLRQELGLVYGITVYPQAYKEVGFLNITTTCSSGNLTKVFSVLKSEIKRIKNEGVKENELKLLLKFNYYRYLMGFDNSYHVNYWLLIEFLRHGDIYLPPDYERLSWQITNEDIKFWAKKIFDFEKATIGVRGDKKLKKKILEDLNEPCKLP